MITIPTIGGMLIKPVGVVLAFVFGALVVAGLSNDAFGKKHVAGTEDE